MSSKVKDLYDRAADSWVRRSPESLSDFTARPFVFDRLRPIVDSATIVDLGCGEGYCARALSKMGAKTVSGIDISPEMVERAAKAEEQDNLGNLHYAAGTVTNLPFSDNSTDIAIGVFVYNYLSIAEMTASMKEVARVLKPGGTFVFTVPHPSLPFLREREEPFYFDHGEHSYFSGRDSSFEGKIWKQDGVSLPVVAVHKLFEDYFASLSSAGFSQLPYVEELGVTPELIAQSPEFFGRLEGIPLHVLFEIRKTCASNAAT